MNTRLIGLALATVYVLGPQSLVSAQHRGHARGIVTGSRIVVGPRIVTGGRSRVFFPRPYYAFRPYARIRPGLFLGFSVPYPYFYSTPYPYIPYYYYTPQAYPYIPSGEYMGYGSTYSVAIPNATPSASSRAVSAAGGVSFEVTPANAAVFVDGVYVGTAGDFTPSTSPLSLAPGRHRFMLRAFDYQSLEFDVEVVAGQVIPYQATLEPQR